MKALKLIIEELKIYVDPYETPLRQFLYLAEVAESIRIRESKKKG